MVPPRRRHGSAAAALAATWALCRASAASALSAAIAATPAAPAFAPQRRPTIAGPPTPAGRAPSLLRSPPPRRRGRRAAGHPSALLSAGREPSPLPLLDDSANGARGRRTSFSRADGHHTPFGKAVSMYKSYLKRLWKDTDPECRRRVARDETADAVGRVERLLARGEEIDGGLGPSSLKAEVARERLLEACAMMTEALREEEERDARNARGGDADGGDGDGGEGSEEADAAADAASPVAAESSAEAVAVIGDASTSAAPAAAAKKPKGRRSILFGAAMGALVACWVFSGSYIFTALFTAMTILGQLEYYRMCMNTGVYPARRISVVGACSMFVTALFAPELHQICLPMFGIWAMIWFLTMRRQVSTIPEIATTFTGMFYLGYIPSFWVRIRLIGGGREPTRLAPLLEPALKFLGRTAESLPDFLPKAVHLPITTGAVFIFWTWLCIAFSDVGAYFVGRSFGRTKLGDVSPAAGATSPNKTVEGLLGGCATSAALATLGAWVQRWPYWYLTGPVHGLYLGALGLIGDLTASMLKRDAGLKDFGDFIPEHGGIMDRVDSFVFTAPYSWVVCAYVLPWLRRAAAGGGVALAV